MTIDPVLLEVLRNRLDAIADEMELTLLKSAASPIVKEGLDASAALFNARGETIAQAAAIPIHLGALQFAAQRIVRAFPPERMREGDAFLLNDPYDGGTHLPDITLAVPVFADGRAVVMACTMCHHQDVGGRTPGRARQEAQFPADPGRRHGLFRRRLLRRRHRHAEFGPLGGQGVFVSRRLLHRALRPFVKQPVDRILCTADRVRCHDTGQRPQLYALYSKPSEAARVPAVANIS